MNQAPLNKNLNMNTKLEQYQKLIFKRVDDIDLSGLSLDIGMFNILWSLDGSQTVGSIVEKEFYALEDLCSKLLALYQMQLIEVVQPSKTDRPEKAKEIKAPSKVVHEKKVTPPIEDDLVGYVRTMLSNDGFDWK